jgi:hypothetical protein
MTTRRAAVHDCDTVAPVHGLLKLRMAVEAGRDVPRWDRPVRGRRHVMAVQPADDADRATAAAREKPGARVFRRPVYSEHRFLERLNTAVVGFLSPGFRRVFGTGGLSDLCD